MSGNPAAATQEALIRLRMHWLMPALGQDQDQAQDQHQEEEEERPRRRPRPRAYWVRRDLANQHRLECSDYYALLQPHMEVDDLQGKKVVLNYTRLPGETFMYLLRSIEHRITKKNTNYRAAIDPGLKLAATLRFLATGDNLHSIGYDFNVGHNTVSKFIPEVLQALMDLLKDQVFPAARSSDDWLAIANKFQTRWNFPHCIGAIDGKHVRVKKPAHSGSLYHNYKGYFSIPLLAVADGDYSFLWVNVGGVGHMSDAQIFLQTDLHRALEGETLGRPAPRPLTDFLEDTINIPYYLVGDEAFGLKNYMMKPYPKRATEPKQTVFNYRLSRARRIIENSFGILATRFRIFLKPMELKTSTAVLVIKVAVLLHNLLMKYRRQELPPRAFDQEDEDGRRIDGDWRSVVRWGPAPGQPQRGRAFTEAIQIRETLCDFFGSTPGIVPWQWKATQVPEPPAVPWPHRPAAQPAAQP